MGQRFFPRRQGEPPPSMVFVDGENLAIRYASLIGAEGVPVPSHVRFERDVYVWSVGLNNICLWGGVRRRHYYTSVQGDTDRITAVVDALKAIGIEAPNVFKKNKSRGSKRVDIQLATDMLIHGARKNYETAVLVAGDEDYVPLVEAVKSEGRSVLVWFVSDGISPALKRAADHFAELDEVLVRSDINPNWK